MISKFGMAKKAPGNRMAVSNQQMKQIAVKISICLMMTLKLTGIGRVSATSVKFNH